MATEPNDRQKIAILDIDAGTKIIIEQKLQDGFLIQSITNLQPKLDKLLVVYALNDIPPT